MCESLPKDFVKTTEVLPFTKYGLSTAAEFRKAEEDIQRIEWLKKAGLSGDEIKLYLDNEAGNLDEYKKIESEALHLKIKDIYDKVAKLQNELSTENCEEDVQPSTSNTDNKEKLQLQKQSPTRYPDGHPMNNIKDLEKSLFGHLKGDIIPITKRRKILRRLERRKQRIQSQIGQVPAISNPISNTPNRSGSLWDLKEAPSRPTIDKTLKPQDKLIGPRKRAMYTIKDNKIVRLEPEEQEENQVEENRAEEMAAPVAEAESQLLEGTKMSIDDIKKIERFKDYEPGTPSKVVYLKNIAPTASHEQLSLLFNQFVLDNGRPIEVRVMTGRLKGEGYVYFRSVELAMQAQEEINGTIVSGQPIIAQFARTREMGDFNLA